MENLPRLQLQALESSPRMLETHLKANKTYSFTQNEEIDMSISEIRPYLYISGLGPVCGHRLLQETGITHILSVIDSHHFGTRVPRWISHLWIRANDYESERLGKHFDTFAAFVADARLERHDAKVLVHCHMGRSRSVTAVLAALMINEGCRLGEAYRLVKEKRSVAAPNAMFLTELRLLERREFGGLSMESERMITTWDKWAPVRERVEVSEKEDASIGGGESSNGEGRVDSEDATEVSPMPVGVQSTGNGEKETREVRRMVDAETGAWTRVVEVDSPMDVDVVW